MFHNEIVTKFHRTRSTLTLNDNLDYVRAIEYNKETNSLFSISDNGFIKFWDINAAKMINEVSFFQFKSEDKFAQQQAPCSDS